MRTAIVEMAVNVFVKLRSMIEFHPWIQLRFRFDRSAFLRMSVWRCGCDVGQLSVIQREITIIVPRCLRMTVER
ncbi:hypothetical protein A9K65_014315 [Mesorhizobium sp. WSM1497]|nr:hypothetical protein A9K65_014315 [Mesorhizobium sp. WSM1497]